jgi:N-acetylglucosamine repressor
MATLSKTRRAKPGRAKSLKIKRRAIASLEAEMLRRIRAQEGLSRVALARQLHLAPSTAGAYVDRLIAEGFLFEEQKVERDLGRPPTLLALNPEGGRFIGVDFEAHNLMATVVDFSQQPMHRIHKPIRPTDSVEQIIGKIERTIEELMDHHARPVLGIGVGVPGIIDPKKQIALHYPHIRGWANIPLGERLAKRFNVEVFLENNIRTMALAELWFGQARNLEDFICLGIRTGIAAGIVVRRRLVHGKNNLAGEIGEWLCPVAPLKQDPSNGRHSWCCEKLLRLEDIVSVPAILRAVSDAAKNGPASFRRDHEPLSIETIAEAARAGDHAVCSVLQKAAQTLAWVVCQIDAAFNPEKVILAGPLSTLGESLLVPLRKYVTEFCSLPHQQPPVIVDSDLGSFNGALGAAALALHEWKPKA